MNYKLTIHCTREHLEKAKWCARHTDGTVIQYPQDNVSENCWIAKAVQEIFPLSNIRRDKIDNDSRYRDGDGIDKHRWGLYLPYKVTVMIDKFDRSSVEERMKLEPFSFTVDIPQETLDIIMQCNGFKSMKAFNEVIFRTPHLELVEAPQMS